MIKNKPHTGDLYEDKNFDYHSIKAHSHKQYITIRHGQLGSEIPAQTGLAIDYHNLVGGGWKKNPEGKMVKVWRNRG